MKDRNLGLVSPITEGESPSGKHSLGEKVVNWLQLFRAPTLPVFLLPVMAGFLVGGGELFSPLGVAFFAWAWLAHHFTFAHNSFVDAVSGYDSGKSPETRPLVRGSISTSTAQKVVYLGLIIVMGFGAILSMSADGSSSLSLTSLVLFSAFGHTYNGFSKVTTWSFLPISAAFACLTVFPYFAIAETVNTSVIILAGFVFLTMWFETDWEGGLKDIKGEEDNLLHKLGVSVKQGKLEIPLRAKLFASILKFSGLGLVTYGILWHGVSSPTALAWGLLTMFATFVTFELTTSQSWDKARILAYTGLMEVASFSLALVMGVPFVGWIPILILIAFSFLWVPIVARAVYHKAWKGRING